MLIANITAAVCAFAIAGGGLWAYGATPAEGSWPMQWGITGDVNWRAPRIAALAFTYVIGAFVLGVTALAANGRNQPFLLIVTSLVSALVFVLYYAAVVRDQSA